MGYWLYPLAPPRLTDLGLEDPTKATLELGGALSWFQPFRNEFAAMPSMHVGYTFLFALTLFWLKRPSPLALAGVAVAGDHAVRGLATANHWWLDGARRGRRACSWRWPIASPLCRALPRPWRVPGAAVRIAMVTEYAYPVLGGVPEHVHNLSRELAARGHEVTVVTSLAPFGMKRRARALDAENLSVHGYRTLRMAASRCRVYSNGSVARVSVGMPGLKARVTRALRGMDVVHAQGLAVPTLPLWSLRTSRRP